MISFVFKFCLLCSVYTAPLGSEIDPSGWVALSPPIKNIAEEEGSQGDEAVWPLFSKRLGEESFMARFPKEPVYKYLSPDEMEIVASDSSDSLYTLTVLKPISKTDIEERLKAIFLKPDIVLAEVIRSTENSWDICYRKDGKWIAETFFLSSGHLYIFQTQQSVFHRENHTYFASSLDVEFS